MARLLIINGENSGVKGIFRVLRGFPAVFARYELKKSLFIVILTEQDALKGLFS